MSYIPPIENKISTSNARAASTLAAAAVYQGTGEDVSKYGRAGVSITSDNATDGVLTMEVSRDNVTWGGPTRNFADTRFSEPHMWNIVEKYFRIKYTNGTTEATNLAIQVQYSVNADILLGHQLDATLIDETEATVVRSVGVGQNPNNVYTNLETPGVDDNNSTTTNLTTGTSLIFTGAWSDISAYAGISVLVDGTASGTVGGVLQMQFSHDGVTVHRNISVTNTDITNVPPRTLGVVAQYFRVIFTADSDLLSFTTQAMFHTSQVGLVSRLDQFLQGTEDVTNVRAAIVGKTGGGLYGNVSVSSQGKIGIDVPLTAFGELKTSESSPIVQVGFIYNINSDFVDTTLVNGSVTQANSMAVLQTSANTNSSAELASVRRIKYRPGQGLDIRGTALYTTGAEGSKQLFGAGDSVNGLFFGFNGTAFGVMRRSNSSENWAAQTAWNIDKMDGAGGLTNPSGITLDPTKGNVFQIKFQWLGFGAIEYLIEDPLTGVFITVHRIQYANSATEPSMHNPSFPLCWYVENTTNNSDITLKGSSGYAAIEGEIRFLGPTNSISNTKTGVGTTLTNIVTIRNRSSFASQTNKTPINVLKYTASVDGTKNADFELIKNATLGGSPSYTDISTNTSVIEYDTAGTTVTGGKNIDTISLAKVDSVKETPKVFDIELVPGDTLTLAVHATSGTTEATVSIRWVEDF